MIFCSTKEPGSIKRLIEPTSPDHPQVTFDDWPEDYGLDLAWLTPWGVGGIQRKQFPGDFLASMHGSERLNREILQMQEVPFKVLLLEGRPLWGTDGFLQGQYAGNIGIERLSAMLWSISFFRKVKVDWTASMSETVSYARRFYKWSMKETHTEFCNEIEYPPNRNADGTAMKVNWILWILQHFPGINSVLAKRIMESEPEPLRWWASGTELERVPGIGKGRADKLRRALKP